jgi:hypothetical protein
MQVGTGKAKQAADTLNALARGRHDHQFFSHYFLNRILHDGQLEYVENANATVNVLATANRYGKTTLLSHRHFHSCIYKIGGERGYLDPVTGAMDAKAFAKLRYNTIHASDLWETSALVWDEAHKLIEENPRLDAFVAEKPKSKPPHIKFIHGSKWKFRTLGHNAEGIDGNSFYLITLDEAGWSEKLEEMMRNVVRVRVADVRGRIDIVGTFKPGVSKDFYKFAVRAGAYTGQGIAFDHRDTAEDDSDGLAGSIRRYLREFGIDLDELADAMGLDLGQYAKKDAA